MSLLSVMLPKTETCNLSPAGGGACNGGLKPGLDYPKKGHKTGAQVVAKIRAGDKMFIDGNPFAFVGLFAILMTAGFFFSCLTDLASWLASLVARSE